MEIYLPWLIHLCNILKSCKAENVSSEALSGRAGSESEVPGNASVKVSEMEQKGFSLLFLM